MPKFNIWIRNPYPFRFEEMQAIEDAIRQVYGGKPIYFKEWPVQYLSIDNTTETTAKQIARALNFAHRQAIISDRKYGRATSEPGSIEVEVRGWLDRRPEWANSESEQV